MLTQKLSKEILEYSKGLTHKKNLEQTIKVFNTTLFALINGGNAPLDLHFKKHVKLPPLKNSLIKIHLLKVAKLYKLFKKNTFIFIKTNDPSALKYIVQNNISILNEMDRVVSMMQESSEKNNHIINLILYVTYIFIILLLIIILAIKRHQLKQASIYINHLESILPICSSCKMIREPNTQPEKQESWTAIESYIENRSGSKFSHGLCPDCVEKLYGDEEWYKEEDSKKTDK